MQKAPAPLWYRTFYTILSPCYTSPLACSAATKKILAHYLGYNATHHVLGTLLTADTTTRQKLSEAVARLRAKEPLQYVLGETTFCDLNLTVTPDVLIPRPETEEMTRHIIENNHFGDGRTLLDVCTGSGCIAIALKKAYPEAQVYALDISQKALAVAEKNATKLGLSIAWRGGDLCQEEVVLPTECDLMVSNPPYIPASQQDTLCKSVVDHEPHLALFVPTKRPYLFYEKIAAIAEKRCRGKVYVEFHEGTSKALKAIFNAHGFGKVTLYEDLQGKIRWLCAQRA